MLDTGLLLSGAAAVAAMWLAARSFGTAWTASETLDRLLLPAIIGILAGRAAALILDDPTSLRSFRAFLVVRGGVEFWAGVAAATATAAFAARRTREPVMSTLAKLAPPALVGYAAFEASCLLREGCYGPHSVVGLRPDGIVEPMLPLGVLVGAALAAVATLLGRRGFEPPLLTVALVALAVGLTRSVASVWLPRLGDGLTRPHRLSIAVTGAAAVVLVVTHLSRRRAAA